MPRKKRFLCTLISVAIFSSSPSWSTDKVHIDLTTWDRQAIEQTIRAQLEALKRNDGVEAFSYASPGIQRHFQSVDNFMAMVKSGYSTIYRSKAVSFGNILFVDGQPVQRVFFFGENRKKIIASYIMQKQPDGEWRINGVYIHIHGAEFV